jgi:hypothetical protein
MNAPSTDFKPIPVQAQLRGHDGQFFQIGVNAESVLNDLGAHDECSLIVADGFDPQRNTLSDCKGTSSPHSFLKNALKSSYMTVVAEAHT